jgi:sugar fermentation stimulation protein A
MPKGGKRDKGLETGKPPFARYPTDRTTKTNGDSRATTFLGPCLRQAASQRIEFNKILYPHRNYQPRATVPTFFPVRWRLIRFPYVSLPLACPMLLPETCQTGTLLKRYQRFLADVALDNGSILTVHCPNSGSMRGCSTPGSPVVISRSDNPKRKYAWSLEMVQEQGVWIGVHTGRTNHLVHEALRQGVIDDFGAITTITPEVVVSAKSRLDFLVESEQGLTYLEVKNCSLAEQGVAYFPDAVTTRGTKHLHELVQLREAGFGAAVLFCIQRSDATRCKPAIHIDQVYAEAVAWAASRGVRFFPYQAAVTPREIVIRRPLPFSIH